MFKFPIDTIVMVEGVDEPGFILGYHRNTDYIVGWNREPTMLPGYDSFEGLAMVVYHSSVTKVDGVIPLSSIFTETLHKGM